MAVRNLEVVQQLSGSAARAESRPGRIGPISLEAKQTGVRRAGNPHAAFDVAGTGNAAWSRCCDTRRRKGGTTDMFGLPPPRHISPLPCPTKLRVRTTSPVIAHLPIFERTSLSAA